MKPSLFEASFEDPSIRRLQPQEAKKILYNSWGRNNVPSIAKSNTENPWTSSLPSANHTYDDLSNIHDFRMPDGIGVTRYFRKPDSMLNHEGDYAMLGSIEKSKVYGLSNAKTHGLNG
jgi:hypothetical protein